MNTTYHIFFTNLANQLKIDIILSLRKKDKNVSELSKDLNVEQSKLSHALCNLKNCHIVEAKKHGKQRIYSLNKNTMTPILNIIEKHSKTFCTKNCKGCKTLKR